MAIFITRTRPIRRIQQGIVASRIIALCLFLLTSVRGNAATPEQPDSQATLVIFNNALPLSADLAGYYAKKRGIPFDHLIGLDCSMAETIERAEYERTIATPLRNALIEREWWRLATSGSSSAVVENKIHYVVLMHGIPLKIAQASNYPGDHPSGAAPMSDVNAAAVDSEIACLGFFNKSISGVVSNPYFRSYKDFSEAGLPQMMLVCRLDAPTGAMVRRMIDDSLSAEKNGLWGMTYVDSRGIREGGLIEGDRWLNAIAADCRKHGIPVIQDDKPDLFPEDYPMRYVAQYYGWYSESVAGAIARDDFRFVPGAVACHIHSFSASSLRDPHKGWVAPLIVHGAAASMGAVYEPYLAMTPNLDLFGAHLRAGYNFAQSAYASVRVLSWMTTFVGDPLYTPFKPLRDELPSNQELEWDAYRKGAELWSASPAESEKQLNQSARELRSGIIYESLGLLETSAGNVSAALMAFQGARKNYKEGDDIMRTAIHEVDLLRGLNKQKEALWLIDKVMHDYPNAHGISLLRSVQDAYVTPPIKTSR